MVDLNELYGTVSDGDGDLTFDNPTNANDGSSVSQADVNSYVSPGGTQTAYLVTDLGAPRWASGMVIRGDSECSSPFDWEVYRSTNGTDWSIVQQSTTYTANPGGPDVHEIDFDTDEQARYWRIRWQRTVAGFSCGVEINTWEITEGAEPTPGPPPPDYEPGEPGQAIIEIYVDDPDGYRWDVAEWDEATWAEADWISITEWCIFADLTWGAERPDAGILADQVAGSWVIETHDPERVLDPANAESQFYPHLVPELPIRVNHNSRTVRTGQVSIITYSHEREGGRISASDAISRASRAKVPPGTALGDTFLGRTTDAVNGAGITLWVSFPSGELMDRPLASADVDARRSAWQRISEAARELLAVAWVDRDGHIRVTEWDADTDRGQVIGSDQLTDLVAWVSHDGLYSVVRALDSDEITIAEAARTPLPAYGEIVYERTEPTIDAADWVQRVLADRYGAVLRYKPGTIVPQTAAQQDAMADMELMDIVTLSFPETDPPIEVRARVLGCRVRVTDRTKVLPNVLTRWEWTLLTTIVPSEPLIADDEDPLMFLVSDEDGTTFLYPG
jgi:hypothetical protein